MREKLDTLMTQFKPDDYTVKLCNAVFTVVPFAPKFQWYSSIADAARVANADLSGDKLQKAKALAESEPVERALWVADALDTGDKGIAIFTGVKTAFGLFFSKDKKNAFESDPQQAADAALKALGMGYMIHNLFPGTVQEKLSLFKELPAGQAMALYYAAIEVAVPFTDNVLTGGGNVLSQLMEKAGKDNTARITSLAGAEGASQAMQIFESLKGSLETIVSKVGQYTGPIAEKAKQHMPGVLDTTDKVAGAVATGADVMPVWRLLGARLAAEACAVRAARGLA